MRHILLLDGGDWADASAAVINVPDDFDVDAARLAYREWFKTYDHTDPSNEYMTFETFLKIRYGATDNTDVETVWGSEG